MIVTVRCNVLFVYRPFTFLGRVRHKLFPIFKTKQNHVLVFVELEHICLLAFALLATIKLPLSSLSVGAVRTSFSIDSVLTGRNCGFFLSSLPLPICFS
jgi:hypothetical protein